MVRRRMTDRMKEYLNENYKPPSDFYLYEKGVGPQDDYCVFCGRRHNNKDNITLWGKDLYGESLKCTCGICGDCSFTLDSHSSSLENTKQRMDMYLSTGMLPTDTDKYSIGNEMGEYCIFCKEILHSSERKYDHQDHIIIIPVGQFNRITYAATVCKDCADDLEKLGPPENTRIRECGCRVCGGSYPVLDSEMEERARNGNPHEYLCPMCLYDYGETGKSRYVSTACGACHGHMQWDRLHYSYHDGNRRVNLCEKCKPKEDNDVFVISEEYDLHVRVYKYVELYYFTIFIKDSGEILKEGGDYKRKDIAIFVGLTKGGQIIHKYGNQLKLW